MRYLILPSEINSTDENGKVIKVNICPENCKRSVDGTQFLIHEELLPPDLKKHVLKATDLENSETKTSGIVKSKVLATKTMALMGTKEWKREEPKKIFTK